MGICAMIEWIKEEFKNLVPKGFIAVDKYFGKGNRKLTKKDRHFLKRDIYFEKR
jgi:hypothetical protein